MLIPNGNDDLLLLILGIYGRNVDSSPYNQTISTPFPAIAVNSNAPLFGNDTYDFTAAGSSTVLLVGDRPLSLALGANVWQVNWWFQPSFMSAAEPRYFDFARISGRCSDLGRLSAGCDNIGGSSYVIGTADGFASVGNWYFCTFAREHLNSTQDVLRFYAGTLGGSCDLQAQSGAFPKSNIVAPIVVGSGDLINYINVGTKGYMTNLRVLRGSNPGGVSFPCPSSFYAP